MLQISGRQESWEGNDFKINGMGLSFVWNRLFRILCKRGSHNWKVSSFKKSFLLFLYAPMHYFKKRTALVVWDLNNGNFTFVSNSAKIQWQSIMLTYNICSFFKICNLLLCICQISWNQLLYAINLAELVTLKAIAVHYLNR